MTSQTHLVPELSSTIEPWAQIAVAAGLVARMQPNFQLFCEVTGAEGGRVFANVLALIWEYAAGINTSIDFEKQREKLEAVTPDPNAFDMYGVWPALDAVVSLSVLLSCCEQFDHEEIAAIADLSHTTISGFLEATGEPDSPDHPLHLQADDYLAELVAVIDPGSERREIVGRIRRIAASIEASNIGLALE